VTAGRTDCLAAQVNAAVKEVIMYKLISSILLVAPIAYGCGASLGPTQRLADAQAAERSARELGANEVPQAQLSLKLAQQQITQAETKIADGDDEEAESLLIRAKADAELSLAQTREHAAGVERQEAVAESAEQKTANINQGAVK
jgi:hypothetical protein